MIPPKVLAQLDLASLQQIPGSFTDRALKELHTDLLYSIRFRAGGTGLLYRLLEHQSMETLSIQLATRLVVRESSGPPPVLATTA